MKKILCFLYKLLYKLGYGLMFLFLLVFISCSIITLKISTEKASNPYCELNENGPEIKIINDKIDYYSYKYNCNSLEIDLYLKDGVGKEQALAIVLEIKVIVEQIKTISHGQVIIVGQEIPNCLFVNLNLQEEGISVVG